ncbi:winged helix-turn-helix transcriptional regulator [Pseudomonas sp. ML2-2023-6]|uniref:winged helix-turn-helix transcriptional regulator n=1 Tax=Pseudomonas sp. ML2-2023-6 TaxID=3122376 RepID=UPI0038621796
MNVRLRQEAIIRSLRRNGSSTIAELAGQVGASRSTLLRDINALREQGLSFALNLVAAAGCNLTPVQFRPRHVFQ